jgi:hypothetical protein
MTKTEFKPGDLVEIANNCRLEFSLSKTQGTVTRIGKNGVIFVQLETPRYFAPIAFFPKELDLIEKESNVCEL